MSEVVELEIPPWLRFFGDLNAPGTRISWVPNPSTKTEHHSSTCVTHRDFRARRASCDVYRPCLLVFTSIEAISKSVTFVFGQATRGRSRSGKSALARTRLGRGNGGEFVSASVFMCVVACQRVHGVCV